MHRASLATLTVVAAVILTGIAAGARPAALPIEQPSKVDEVIQ